MKGIATPVSSKTENVTIRLSGAWLELWKQLRDELNDYSDSEILRQAIALRAALVAVDAKGNRPQTFIKFVDESGKTVQVDLEEHVGIAPASVARKQQREFRGNLAPAFRYAPCGLLKPQAVTPTFSMLSGKMAMSF